MDMQVSFLYIDLHTLLGIYVQEWYDGDKVSLFLAF
jgi:hypothetical protein